MEFILASQADPAFKGNTLPPYSILRQKPVVTVDHQLRLLETPENRAAFTESVADGSCAIKIRRQELFHEADAFPARILLELTTRCNLLCAMCPRNAMTRKEGDLPVEVCLRVLDEASAKGVAGIWLYNLGESLLHPNFWKILDHAGSLPGLGCLWLSTNGVLLTKDNANRLLESKLSFLNVSLLAHNPSTYATIAGQDNYARVVSNVQHVLEMRKGSRPTVRVQMIEQQQARDEIDAYLHEWLGKADIVSVNQLEFLEVEANTYGKNARKRPPRGHCRRVARGDCIVCSNGAVVQCDAAYNGCREGIGKLYLGNVHEQTLSEIWNSQARADVLSLEAQGRMTDISLCQQCYDYDF